jgi:hypothetical protein
MRLLLVAIVDCGVNYTKATANRLPPALETGGLSMAKQPLITS